VSANDERMDMNGLHTLGNEYLLRQPATGFLCSNDGGDDINRMCKRWALMQSESGNQIICGHQSIVEKEVFEVLLSGTQPIVLVLARGIPLTLDDMIKTALEKNQLLVVSPFRPSITRMTKETALIKNELIILLSQKIVVGYERPGGQLEMLLSKTKKDLMYLASEDE
ncbi:MAG: hypothetical protein SH856_14585, partial [Flavobacteriales bacterium]|nr:hypothetical protein [Flavobacteriales bacterium]